MNQQEVTAAITQGLAPFVIVSNITGQSSLRTSGGSSSVAYTLSPVYRNTALTNTGVMVTTGARTLLGWNIINNTASVLYVKIYDLAIGATASNTPNRVLAVPANGGYNTQDNTGFSQGAFALGISIRCCAGLADNDNTAPSVGIYVEILHSL